MCLKYLSNCFFFLKWFILYSHEQHKRITVDLCLISILSIVSVFFYSILFCSFQSYFNSLWFSLLFQEDLWCGYFLYISVGIPTHFNVLIDYLHVFICGPFELYLMMNYRSLHLFWTEFHYKRYLLYFSWNLTCLINFFNSVFRANPQSYLLCFTIYGFW